MTHSFEGSKEYDKLSKAVLDYAKSKGEYNKAFQDLKNTYAGVYSGEKLNQVVEKEAVANILGEKLGSKEFINDLVNGTYSTENKTLVQKIYDFVKNQINRFKGYKDQEQYWNHVKELFDTAMNKSEISQEGLKSSVEANKMTETTDSQGRQLSQGQVEHNKDSKFRDNEGNLLALHHVTEKQFTVFESEKYGANTGERLKGIYMSTKPAGAFGDVDMNLYANVTNPVTKNDNNITKEQFEELSKLKYPNVSQSNLESAWESLRHTNDLYILEQLSPRNAQDNQKFIDNVIRITGYDGAIYNDEETDVNNRVYVAFNSNQVKNIDNLNPTENNDIRYSKETGNKIPKEVQSLIDEEVLERFKNEDKTEITETIEELEERKSKLDPDRSDKEWYENYDLREKIRALKGGYKSVYDMLVDEETTRLQEDYNYNPEKYERQVKKIKDEQEKQAKLQKEIDEASPLKKSQYEVIQENNPMFDDEHVGIRSPKDIKTFDEVINDEESFVWGDYSKEDAQRDLERGKVMIYSSYPIHQGTFVSTSKIQAEQYAGGEGNRVYSKEVPLYQVAWINGDEGQYANVGKKSNEVPNIQKDSQGRTLSKQQQEYFKDSKVRDKNGNLLEVYHGTGETFTKFEKEMIGSNYFQDEQGFFFTDDIKQAEEYADYTNYGMPRQKKGNVMKTFLNITNPYVVEIDYDPIGYWDENYENILQKANKNQNDGVIIKAKKYQSMYVAFEPNQIKNVDNLNPTDNPDIRYSVETEDLKTDNQGRELSKEQQYPQNVKEIKNIREFLRKAIESETNEEWKNRLKDAQSSDYTRISRQSPLQYKREIIQQYLDYKNNLTDEVDNKGRRLTQNQVDFYKNIAPEFRDEEGNIKTYYHGTTADFNEFDTGKIDIANLGKGFYFTDIKEIADSYAQRRTEERGGKARVIEAYINSKKPFDMGNVTREQAVDYLNYDFYDPDNAITQIIRNNEEARTEAENFVKEFEEEQNMGEKRVSRAEQRGFIKNNNKYDYSMMIDTSSPTFQKWLRKEGYDSILVPGKDKRTGLEGTAVVVLNPNEIKYTDNKNPTNNSDMRYSKDTTGAWNNFIEKYFKNEGTGTAIKDMKKLPVKTYSMQDIDNVLNETTLSDELKQEFRNDLKGKTITKEIFNEYKDAIKQVEKDFESYNAERPPSWDNLGEVFEQPSEEVKSPLQDRDIETIGKETKKNAYQYENPEVKPYFQEMAQMIGEDLAYASDPMNRRTKKGGGTVLQANTKAINDLHNKYGYSYEQIGTGLNNIIEDNGAENNAVSKKIEFYIDDALRNGYRNIQGQYIQPNQDYINTIQYSMETENQAEKIEEEKPKPKVLNPTQISNLTLEDVSTTPKLPNKKYKEGSKVSSFVSNIENDVGFLNEEEKQELLKDDNVKYYAEITNADTLAKAYDNLKENGKDATLKWYAKPTANATAEDVATGWILLKQYSDNGDTEGMVNVAKKLRDMGTKAGQTVQAFNILSRLTPEGMVAYTQGELQDAYNEMIKGKSKKWIDQHKSDFDLSQDEIAFIMDTMQNLPAEDPSNNNYDRKVALGQIQKLFTDKIPSENNKIKAWMRISMLFNPKTQVRNVTGNAGVVPVNMTSDFLGSKVDKILSKYTGVRTLGNPNAKAYLKGMKEGFYQSYNDFKLGINTRDIEQNKFEFGQGKAFKDKGIGKALNRVDNMLNFIMDFGDRGFSQASFVNSLNNQMLLNGVTTPTQDMIDIATQEALSRTWNDNNEYTKFVLGVRRALNKVGTKNYGLGDVLIPFAKTPANLTKAIVEYSPVGLTKQILNIKDIKNAIETGQFTSQQQHEFADKMGKGLAGTLLYVAGYALAQAGIATGEPDEDKDVKNFMKNSLGIAPYSIKIGDKSFTYDWSQPVATPLAIMTNLYQTNKNNPDATMLDKIMSATNIGTNQLMEQSFMESLNEVLNGNGEITDRIQKAILDLPARAIPTFSKQIADMVDGTQRTSFEYGQPVKSAINSAKAKLPFVSKELTPVVDTLGNEVEKYGGENNWFNVFFNPANMNKGKKTKAGEEIYNVYQETGDTTIFPVTAPYYVNQDGAKITMDSKQRAEYQKTAGDYTEETVNKLINDSDYQKLDDPEKAEILSQVVKDSNEKAKRDVLNINNKSSDLELIDKVGADYYTYKIATKGMKTDAEQCEALERKNYSNQNKQLIYESEINKDDKTFEGLKKINKNFNMDEYLKYKTQKFSGDTKKEDTINYVNGLNLNGIERLYIIGRTYKLKEDRELFESLLKNKMPLQDVDSILQTLK